MSRFNLHRLSIRQRLPLLICALLLSVILIFGVIAYLGVRKAALKVGEERLQTLSQQLGSMLSGNTHNLISNTHAAANTSSVKSFLLSNGIDSATEVKKLLKELQKDSSYVQVELRTSDRTTIFNSSKKGTGINISIDTLLTIGSQGKIDSGRIGKIYEIDDAVFYPIVATITDDNKLIGYLIRWRKMGARGLDQISKLMGTDAKLYIGNTDGSLWTDMRKPVAPLPLNKQNITEVIEYSRSGNTVLASIRPIADSQWLVSIEFPRHKILQAAKVFLYWLMIAGGIILVLGIFVTWLMSRNITRPLRNLTMATSAITEGNYSPVVQVNRHDELGELARAFNAMTAQVRDSQQALEKKAENYRLLFESNPMPMWIISRVTLFVLDVNKAAIKHYGYSKEEFLKLNAKDLRPAEDVEKYLAYAGNRTIESSSGTWKHQKKNGSIIMVDVMAENIIYKDQEARIILANDVTEKLKMEAELVHHRIMQQEIITETTIQAQEKEREEIGKELHDNINQILASTKLYLELARSGNSELLAQAISKSYENVNLAIGEIRQLSKQLVPPSLDSTLIETIKGLIEEIHAATPISILLLSEDFDESIVDENIKLIIYRIVQEQVNNILKHADATHVTIEIENNYGNVSLQIMDDGIGFDTGQKSKGIGLRNIDNRVKFYKGSAAISSQKGKGCKLEVSIPMKRENGLAISL